MNLVIFLPDEMRAESLSCYGHPLVRTPNYDRLCEEGVRFDQCYVQHTVCTPSRCSLMTGWYPHVAGHRTLWHLLRPHEPSLLRDLRSAGYHIEWHGKNDLYSPSSFPLAVDTCTHEPGGHAGPNPYAIDDPHYYSFDYRPFPGGLHETGDMRNVQKGIDFLHSRAAQAAPFVLYLPLSMPHPPYAAPEPFHSMYDPADLPPLRPAGLPNKPDYYDLIRRYRRLDELDEPFFRRIQATYLGMCTYCDWMLGQLLRALDESGLADDTALIVSADHGDWAGDYGLVEKWPSALDEALTRVPLIIRAPNGKAGHVVREPMELLDVMATCYDLAGVRPQHTHFSRSLMPQLGGAAGDSRRAVFAEGGYDRHEPFAFEGRTASRGASQAIFADRAQIYYPKGLQQQEHPDSVCRSVMIRLGDHKLVLRTHGVNELYDLKRDPRELDNRYDDPALASIRADLKQRLLDWYVSTADVVPWDEDPRGLPPQR